MLSQIIRQKRKEKGYALAELARKLNITTESLRDLSVSLTTWVEHVRGGLFSAKLRLMSMTTATLLPRQRTLPARQPIMLILSDRSERHAIVRPGGVCGRAGTRIDRAQPIIRESRQRNCRFGVDPCVAAYARGITEAEPTGVFVTEQAAVFTFGYCGERCRDLDRIVSSQEPSLVG
jgi:hypothetical protein